MTDREAVLDEALAYEGGSMTEWEVEFVDSLDKQRRKAGEHWQPTHRQESILMSIVEKL